MKPKKSKTLCSECYCDDYNHGLGGAKVCFRYKDAKVILRKKVHINQVPPWTQKPEWRMSCYNKPQWYFVNGDATS